MPPPVCSVASRADSCFVSRRRESSWLLLLQITNYMYTTSSRCTPSKLRLVRAVVPRSTCSVRGMRWASRRLCPARVQVHESVGLVGLIPRCTAPPQSRCTPETEAASARGSLFFPIRVWHNNASTGIESTGISLADCRSERVLHDGPTAQSCRSRMSEASTVPANSQSPVAVFSPGVITSPSRV